MSTLLIPISPLERAKSRLRTVLSRVQIEDLIIAMVKDLANKLSHIKCFNAKIVYCGDTSILELAESYDLVGIKEQNLSPQKSFDTVIEEINLIAIEQFNAEQTILTFLDTVLISEINLKQIHQLIVENELVICPSIHSAGISVLGRNPPDIIPTCFSDPRTPSFLGQVQKARKEGLTKVKVYDSFRAGFDIDIERDLVLAYEYLKVLESTDTHTYAFLERNLELSLKKNHNNRDLKITANHKKD